jgi:hypothetical protein
VFAFDFEDQQTNGLIIWVEAGLNLLAKRLFGGGFGLFMDIALYVLNKCQPGLR